MERKREAWVDAAKGIAIVFVVLGHVVSSYHNSGLLKDAAVFQFVFTFAYSFHMPLFFVLSGYLGAKTTGSANKLQRIGYKAVSLLVPYVVFSVVTWGVKFVLASLSNTAVGIKDLLLIPIFPINHMWYIYALAVMAVLHILLSQVLSSRKGALIAAAAALGVKLLFAWTGWLESWGLAGSVFEDVLNYAFWYFAGCVCAGRIGSKRPTWVWSIPTVAALLAYGTLLWFLSEQLRSQPLVNLLISGAGTALFILLSLFLQKNRVLAYLGRNSLPIYLLHGLVISAARILLSKLGIPLLQGAVPMVVCGLLGIVAPLLGYWVCSKIKPLDFCFYPGKYVKKRKP